MYRVIWVNSPTECVDFGLEASPERAMSVILSRMKPDDEALQDGVKPVKPPKVGWVINRQGVVEERWYLTPDAKAVTKPFLYQLVKK